MSYVIVYIIVMQYLLTKKLLLTGIMGLILLIKMKYFMIIIIKWHMVGCHSHLNINI